MSRELGLDRHMQALDRQMEEQSRVQASLQRAIADPSVIHEIVRSAVGVAPAEGSTGKVLIVGLESGEQLRIHLRVANAQGVGTALLEENPEPAG